MGPQQDSQSRAWRGSGEDMTEVFLERAFERPLAVRALAAMTREGSDCFELYRLTWRESLVATDSSGMVHRMVCRFHAPDAESARIALRRAGVDVRTLWPGTVHEAPSLDTEMRGSANVLVERSFRLPVTVEQIQALEDAGAGCLQNHRVVFVRTFFSLDCRRMLCLYRAPDAESVRLAQRQADMPVDRVWSFQSIRPTDT